MQHRPTRSRHRGSYRGVDEKTLMGLLISLLDTQVPRAKYALCFTAGRARAGVWQGPPAPGAAPFPLGFSSPILSP